jgi:putative FmdB family regulatory protein
MRWPRVVAEWGVTDGGPVPIYEYVCKACGKKSSLLFSSFATVEKKPHCPHCDSLRLSRLISHPAVIRASRGASDTGELRVVNPRQAVENLSRQYDSTGVDAGREFEDVARRAAAGDSPATLHEMVSETRRNRARKKKGAGHS